MTVALVLATATACDLAPRPAIASSSGDTAGAAVLGARGSAAPATDVTGTGAPSAPSAASVGAGGTGAGGTGASGTGAGGTGVGTPGAGGSDAGTDGANGAGTDAPGTDASGMYRSGAGTTRPGKPGQPGWSEAARAASDMAAGLPLPSLHGGRVAMEPLLARLCGQLRALGIDDIVVITPPGRGEFLAAMAWEGVSHAGGGLRAGGNIEVVECASVDAELRAAASVIRSVSGSGESLLVCAGDMVAHTEALARLGRSLTTTALATGMTSARVTADPDLRPALRLSQDRGGTGSRGTGEGWRAPRTVAAAGSAFHRVNASNAVGCGAFLVAPPNQDELAAVADELADLAEKDRAGHGVRANAASRPNSPRGGFTDSSALLLVGMVRSGIRVEALDTGALICLRVRTPQQATAAAAQLHAVNEDRVRLDAAVKPAGFVATLLVNPYSRFLALWAARRRLTPEAVTGMSIGLGLVAAVWFSTGATAGLIVGAVFAFGAFVLDCADDQLARYERRSSAFSAWLDRLGGRVTEYAVYVGLAAGAGDAASVVGSGWAGVLQRPSVWELAIAALMLQSLRDMIGFGANAVSRLPAEPAGPPLLPLDEPADYAVPTRVIKGRDLAGGGASRWRIVGWARTQARRMGRLGRAGIGWLARIVEFGPGERVAVICVTAVVAGARMVFIVLLIWGLVAMFLTVISRMVKSLVRTAPVHGEQDRTAGQALVAYRDDGVIAQSLGKFVEGQLPPLPPAIVGVTVATVLSVVGTNGFAGVIVLAPVVAMALAGLGSANPHDGRLDWLVPPSLQLGQFVFLAALALAGHVPLPLAFALAAIIVLHYYDIVYRTWPGTGAEGDADGYPASPATMPTVPRWLSRAGLGWEGRMLVAGFGALLGAETATFALLTVYLWMLFVWESLTGWAGVLRSDRASPREGFARARTAGGAAPDLRGGGG
ncbi:MAG: DUF5941 domain-containing protein [Micromonosporaceae bacterium]